MNLKESKTALSLYLREGRGISCTSPCRHRFLSGEVYWFATILGQQYLFPDSQGVGHAVVLTPAYPANGDFSFRCTEVFSTWMTGEEKKEGKFQTWT